MDQRYKIGRITPTRVGRQLKYLARHAISAPGRLPDAVIVGAMKGGTTSLSSYLAQHPDMHGSIRKEVHYFDRHYGRGIVWYRKHFTRCSDGVVFEATPDYMFHRTAFDRLRTVLPNAELIVSGSGVSTSFRTPNARWPGATGGRFPWTASWKSSSRRTIISWTSFFKWTPGGGKAIPPPTRAALPPPRP